MLLNNKADGRRDIYCTRLAETDLGGWAHRAISSFTVRLGSGLLALAATLGLLSVVALLGLLLRAGLGGGLLGGLCLGEVLIRDERRGSVASASAAFLGMEGEVRGETGAAETWLRRTHKAT
jgi:hypothetical protein